LAILLPPHGLFITLKGNNQFVSQKRIKAAWAMSDRDTTGVSHDKNTAMPPETRICAGPKSWLNGGGGFGPIFVPEIFSRQVGRNPSTRFSSRRRGLTHCFYPAMQPELTSLSPLSFCAFSNYSSSIT
jgi:hypothetical protein